ncbi:MFS general substrate transporter [Schizopora paradoxa]|uniref:MFS general substrate transporter n=1 Tax=Schizopora paradoxa TaxID=27342 RepID=A0A0H2RI84_9AGAM|nr:MFS general substrate transporter [Schizopora paradoxa]
MDQKSDISSSHNAEKGLVETIVHEEHGGHSDDRQSLASSVDEKKLIRKIDWTLIPWLSFLYFLSFLDRTSIGNAKLYNMEEDLHLTDTQYLICLTVFFFSYTIFEVPSNIFLKRLRPSIWLSFTIFCWGIMMASLLHNYGGLLGMRWMLGMFEAGLFPGVSYLLSCWYKRSELGFRSAIFFSAATVSGAFGGLLAAAISNMDGVGGKPGWQEFDIFSFRAWISILEGLLTVIAGVASFYFVQDFPNNAKILNDDERAFIIRRLQSDNQFSAAGESLRRKYIIQSLTDWKTWNGMLMFMGANGPLYAFSLFLPSIVNQLGFTATPANLLTVPVYVMGCICTCAVGFMADRVGNRGYFAFFDCLDEEAAFTGYLILIFSRNAALSYFAVFLGASGIYPLIVSLSTWMANNVEGSYKRSVTLAMCISFGNLNGAVSSNVYRARDAPWYTLGHGIVLTYIGLGFIASAVYSFRLRAENLRRARGERDEIIVGEDEIKQGMNSKNGTYETIEEAKREKGDQWSGYKYTL